MFEKKKKTMATSITFFDGFVTKKGYDNDFFDGFATKKVMIAMLSHFSMVVVL
jgi:hypothetical protein